MVFSVNERKGKVQTTFRGTSENLQRIFSRAASDIFRRNSEKLQRMFSLSEIHGARAATRSLA